MVFKKIVKLQNCLKIGKIFYYKYIEQTEGWDQPSLRVALWSTNLKQYVLPVEYNVRPESVLKKIRSMSSEVLGDKHLKPKIYHAHYSSDVHKNIFEIDELEILEKKSKEKIITNYLLKFTLGRKYIFNIIYFYFTYFSYFI